MEIRVLKPRVLPHKQDGQDGDMVAVEVRGIAYLGVKLGGKWRYAPLVDDIAEPTRTGGIHAPLDKEDSVSTYFVKGRVPIFDVNGRKIGDVLVYET